MRGVDRVLQGWWAAGRDCGIEVGWGGLSALKDVAYGTWAFGPGCDGGGPLALASLGAVKPGRLAQGSIGFGPLALLGTLGGLGPGPSAQAVMEAGRWPLAALRLRAGAVSGARDADHTTPTDKERPLGARLSDDKAVAKMGHPGGEAGLATLGPLRRWGARVFVGHEEAEGHVDGFGDAYAGGGDDGGWAEAVVEDAEGGFGAGDVDVVFGEGDAQGLAETAGAGAEELRLYGDGEAAEARHRFKACNGLEGADEDAAGLAFGLAGEVEAVVHAVDEVDVGESGRAEEDGVAGGLADEAVGGWVGEAEVGFDFGDAAGEALAVEGAGDELAEEVARDYFGGVEIEAAGQEGGHG